jgi:hypothetical protein
MKGLMVGVAYARFGRRMIRRVMKGVFWLSCLLLLPATARAQGHGVYRVRLNGLELGVDEENGSLVFLGYAATGTIMETSGEASGLLEVAYPNEAFAPLRLASRFSHARIARTSNAITINWDGLGPSRSNVALPAGKVQGEVTIRSAEDGRSVMLSCRIENRSPLPIPQVLFPDLWGMKPIDGVKGTQLRLARGVVYPFEIPIREPEAVPPYYERVGWKEYPAGEGYYALNALRWIDYGGYQGGLSIFQKKWGTEDRPDLLTYRSEQHPMNLRLAWQHKERIEAGHSWESGEFCLTPHEGGWAKGIEVFRDYVRQANPPRDLPRHVRDGLGFQTIWMTQAPERDPHKAYFRFEDLPRVAEDARVHGLEELTPWFWCSYFRVPIPLRLDLGTQEEFLGSVRKAKELGVNVAPFASVHIILNSDLQRYGAQPGHDDWTYHPELIPQFRPYYTHELEGTLIEDDNPLWQQDVQAALSEWINRGVPSLTFDQFIFKEVKGHKPGLVELIERVRALARSKDPQSTFGSESVTDLELESQVLDYTWNWLGYVDTGPILNVLRSPRLNCNVDDSALVVKKGFADGLYLNVMPSKPDQPNGTALISERPALSTALKEAAALRKQFLPFFVEGTFLGDSVLSQPSSAFIRAHQLGTKLLIIVLNDQLQPQSVAFTSNLGLWLPRSGSYQVQSFDSGGRLLESGLVSGGRWLGVTPLLPPEGLLLFVIEAK